MSVKTQSNSGDREQEYWELVAALYSAPRSILVACTSALLVTGVCWRITADFWFVNFCLAFAVVGAGRAVSLWRFTRAGGRRSRAVAQRFEIAALVGVWSFSGLSGLLGAYTVSAHHGTDTELLVVACVMGYIAGISSRNASRPLITMGQISANCLPMVVALLLQPDLVRFSLAVFITLLFASTVVMAQSVHATIVARQRAVADLETLASRDPLTGALNRTAFMNTLAANLDITRSRGEPTALVSIDLDRFKDVNDSLGHAAGDTVLKETANRLRALLPAGQALSRIGGDEFLITIVGPAALEARALAEQMLVSLAQPFEVANTRALCGGSAGVAVAPRDGHDIEELMRHADLALYEAKTSGRGLAKEYSPGYSQRYHDRLALEHDLQGAIARGELELQYQPIVDSRSGRTICCEALLRWNHPQRGPIAPSVFVPIAESTGLIVPIGLWALRTACREATLWPADIRVAVNLSALQFRGGDDIVAATEAILGEVGLPPGRLELEVTETVLVDDTATTLAIIERFHRLGVGMSLDDFGIGFSSLAYLSDFPFSKVKIDKKFSQDIGRSRRARRIVRGIAQITRELDIELVAEGVETHGQLQRLQALGIHAIQGYYFSRALEAEAVRAVIAAPISGPFAHPQAAREPALPELQVAAG
jgi:diguanylate cyclase (GGDEF)-like protein